MSTTESAAASHPAGRSSRRGATYARGDVTRQRILDSAWQAFAERGFHGASMNEIARSADVTLAGLIFHYPNKVALFLAMLDEREASDTASLEQHLGESPTGFEVLDEFARHARMNQERFQHVQLFHLNSAESASGSGDEHPGAAFAKRHFRFARKLVEDSFQRSIEFGEVRADINPRDLALQVVGMSEGIENQWLQEPDAIDLGATFTNWVTELKAYLHP